MTFGKDFFSNLISTDILDLFFVVFFLQLSSFDSVSDHIYKHLEIYQKFSASCLVISTLFSSV